MRLPSRHELQVLSITMRSSIARQTGWDRERFIIISFQSLYKEHTLAELLLQYRKKHHFNRENPRVMKEKHIFNSIGIGMNKSKSKEHPAVLV